MKKAADFSVAFSIYEQIVNLQNIAKLGIVFCVPLAYNVNRNQGLVTRI